MTGAVHLEGVWKSYPRWTPGSRTLRGVLSRRVPALMRFGDQRWALRDISLDVPPGASLGLIGHNGAGKSTLLRLAAGLGRPTRGTIRVPAATASVLGLGETFDASLTGRENALTAAIVAGMREPAARACLPAVLEFAELAAFADAPVRTYSDGMKLRLAFGVVAQLRPRALLLDEVLAVGDARFQARCLEHVASMREDGTALLFASHDLDQVALQCDRAVWLHGGQVRALGPAGEVVAAYREAMASATLRRTPASDGADGDLELGRNRFGSQEVTIEDVALLGSGGAAVSEIVSGQGLRVRLRLAGDPAAVGRAIVSVSITRTPDWVMCCDVNTEQDAVSLSEDGEVAVTFERLGLAPGRYAVDVGVHRGDWEYAYDYHHAAYPFTVVGPGAGGGLLVARRRWEVGHGSMVA